MYIFTASFQFYADIVRGILDPDNQIFKGILSRSHCLKTKHSFFIKDLRIIQNREMKDIIIVDNLIHSFAFQLDNGIPIVPWKGDRNDKELKFLLDFLIELSFLADVREGIRQRFQLSNYN